MTDARTIYTDWLKRTPAVTGVVLTTTTTRMLEAAQPLIDKGLRPLAYSPDDVIVARELINWSEEAYRRRIGSNVKPALILSETPPEVEFMAGLVANKGAVADATRSLARMSMLIRQGRIDEAAAGLGSGGAAPVEKPPQTLTDGTHKWVLANAHD